MPQTKTTPDRTALVAGMVTVLLAAGPVAGAAPSDTKPAPSGARIDTVAGNGVRGYSGDGGSARSAMLNEPRDVSVDRAGTLYVSDTLNHRVRRIDAGGAITTLAGTGVAGAAGDGGPAASAELSWPHGTALDPAETALYVADAGNHRIRRIDLATGIISTLAGNGTPGFAGDGGPASAAQLTDPKGLAALPSGDLLIADTGNDRIRRVDPSGVITTVAGNGTTGFAGDGGPATSASFDGPRDLAAGPGGEVYVADDNNDRVRRIDPAGIVTTVAGSGQTGEEGDGGPAAVAQLSRPRGVAVGGDGSIYIADSENHRLRVVDPAGVITTLAGIGREGFGGDGGPSQKAKLFLPRGVTLDSAGTVFVADTNNGRIRRVSRG